MNRRVPRVVPQWALLSAAPTSISGVPLSMVRVNRAWKKAGEHCTVSSCGPVRPTSAPAWGLSLRPILQTSMNYWLTRFGVFHVLAATCRSSVPHNLAPLLLPRLVGCRFWRLRRHHPVDIAMTEPGTGSDLAGMRLAPRTRANHCGSTVRRLHLQWPDLNLCVVSALLARTRPMR